MLGQDAFDVPGQPLHEALRTRRGRELLHVQEGVAEGSVTSIRVRPALMSTAIAQRRRISM